VLPVVTALTRQVVEDVDSANGEQLRSLGASGLLRSVLLAWDERYALLTVVIAAFGRAISEVGAVMIVGGNIDGFTRVMTTAIALETSKGDLPLALALGIVLLAVVLALNALIAAVRRWRLVRSDRPLLVQAA
jgi:tungstate transport system permease protein